MAAKERKRGERANGNPDPERRLHKEVDCPRTDALPLSGRPPSHPQAQYACASSLQPATLRSEKNQRGSVDDGAEGRASSLGPGDKSVNEADRDDRAGTVRDGSVVANRRQNDDAANQRDNDELKDRHLPTRPAAQDTNDHKQEKVTENSVNNSAHGTFTWLMGKSRERQRCERQPQPLPAPAERRHEYPETKVAWRTPPRRVWLSREGIRDAVSAYNGTSWLGGDTLIAKVFNEALTYKELNLATPDGCGTERNGHDRRCAGALNALVLHIKRLIRRVELRFRQVSAPKDAEHVGQPESTRRQPRSLVRSATSVFENSGLPQLQWRHLPWKQSLRSAH